MSDSRPGPGWWQASDGKWYAPEQHPDASSTLPPPSRRPTPQGPLTPQPAITPFGSHAAKQKKPWWRRWWVLATGAVVISAIIAGIAGDKDPEDAQTVATVPITDSTTPVDDTADSAAPVTSDAPQDQPDDDLGATDTTEPPTTDEPADVDVVVVGTRDNPFRIGEAATITLDSFGDGDGSVWTIVVEGPGTDVTDAVREENPFNDPPPDGSIYFGVPVSLSLEGANKEPLSTLLNLELEFFGGSSLSIIDQGFDEGCGVAPGALDPFTEVFIGGTLSGIVCLAVGDADLDAGVLLTTDSGDGDRIFFATSGESVDTEPGPPPADVVLPVPDDDAEPGSRTNPFAIGEAATITVDSFGDGDGSVWTIIVDDPGTDLTSAVAAENPFNEPPPEGSIFFGVPVTLSLDSADKEPLSMLFNLELEFFGPATLSIIDLGFDEGCGVTPNGLDLFKELFPGGANTGVVCLAVTDADIEAGVLLTTDSGDGDRIYFATS